MKNNNEETPAYLIPMSQRIAGMNFTEVLRYIRADWQNVNPYANVYLCSLENRCFQTNWQRNELILRFLCNASGYRTDNAKHVKMLLKQLSNEH